MMRRYSVPLLLAVLFAALLTAPALAGPNAAPAPMPAGTASPRDWSKLAPEGELLSAAVKSDSAILMDACTGKILFDKDGESMRYPASTTKIMTCLVALDSGKKLSENVSVGTLPKLPSDASSIGLINGEVMTFGDLLYGLMLESGNDAANAVAAFVGDGSIPDFVDMMNKKAQELGMTGTHYTNPNGLHDPDHYTTARDMAILDRAALSYPDYVKIVSTFQYTMAPTNKHSKSRIWKNHNKLIDPSAGDPYGYVYDTGGKTGYTDEAQQTLVTSARKGGMNLIAVAMHSLGQNDKWTDSITMFEYGFSYYDTVDLKQLLASGAVTETVKNAAASDEKNGVLELEQLPKTKNAFITDRKEIVGRLKDDPSLFVQTLSFTEDTAPIKMDDVVGTAAYAYNGETVLECDLIASRDVAEMPAPISAAATQAKETEPQGASASSGASAAPGGSMAPAENAGGPGHALVWAGAAVLLILLALIAYRVVRAAQRNRKYRQYNYRQNGNTRARR